MKRIGLLVVVSVFLSSCGGSRPTEVQVEGLDIIGSWSIDQVYLSDEPEGIIGQGWGIAPMIRFDSNGYFWGNAPCNDYQAAYVFDGETIEITYMSTSAVLCLDERMDKDKLLLQVFGHGSIDVVAVGQGSGMEWVFPDGRVVLTRFDG